MPLLSMLSTILPSDLSWGFAMNTFGRSWILDSGITWSFAWVGVLLISFAIYSPPD